MNKKNVIGWILIVVVTVLTVTVGISLYGGTASVMSPDKRDDSSVGLALDLSEVIAINFTDERTIKMKRTRILV